MSIVKYAHLCSAINSQEKQGSSAGGIKVK